MRRVVFALLSISAVLVCAFDSVHAQQDVQPSVQKISVPPSEARSVATQLSLEYRNVPGVQISPDQQNGQLVVMAPEATQQAIAQGVQEILSSKVRTASARASGPVSINLAKITWREFEDDLQRLSGGPLPVTTTRNGERASFQLIAAPMQGTTVEVDRRNNTVTVVAPPPSVPGWRKLIASLDQLPAGNAEVTELMRLENAEPAPIQRALRLLKELEYRRGDETVTAAPVGANSPFRNAVFQQDGGVGGQTAPGAGDPAAIPEGDEAGAGVIGDTQIQFVPELGTIIIRGAKRDVERVMEVIKQIEEQSEITKPDIEVVELKHADSNAVAGLLQQLYEDVLSARQGEVSITSLDSPNALLLIGRTEAIAGLKELIVKIDQPVSEASRLRVFRLRYASAVDAEVTIRDFFADRPGTGDDLRPGVGPRVRVLADYRTNSLIVSAAPRDLVEVTRLINDLDVEQHTTQNQIKVFTLNNAAAEDLAEVIQEAITGEGAASSDSVTAPSSTLAIMAVDANSQQMLESGVLAGTVVTADTGANALVVRAPAASIPLIAELIRQLDIPPGIESLVKVFTIENGDAVQLTTSLQTLFGADAATTGTQVGGANIGDLPSATASGESSLVPLTFSSDQRTNSIIASGSSEDLEVVESILLRLDSEGFAERITEVIWLRHQASDDVALAIQTYVQQRTQTVNTIQQYQQGLGPYDLPDRDLIVVSEPVSNSVLLSVSPRLYEDVRRIIDKLDRRPPMVLIKVMLAEVRLDDAFEIGGEFGLQDSLLYDRGIAAGSFPGATNPSWPPGFDFNNTGLGLGLDGNGDPIGNSFGAGNLAARGVTTFGVGATNSTLGFGGFVLSAASDSINVLLRTLQEAERLQILSRPQIMTMDNTDGYVQVGRQIARITGLVNNGVNGIQTEIEDIEVGLIMQIRPRVGSDGLIVMDIDATRSDRDDNEGTLVPTGGIDGDVILIDDILRTTAQSTVAAYSGQTVIFGGLIQKTRAQVSRRVPIVADIPVLGHFFKYDQEVEGRTELLVIMTPMLVTEDQDFEYVKQVESSRMSWCLADVVEAHGDVGLSGGYGLWGPTVGGTIYPDLMPTAEPIAIPPGERDFDRSDMIDSESGPLPPASSSKPPINGDQRVSSIGPNQGIPATSFQPKRRAAPASTSVGAAVMPTTYPQPNTPQLPARQTSWADQSQPAYAPVNPGDTSRIQSLNNIRLGADDALLTSD